MVVRKWLACRGEHALSRRSVVFNTSVVDPDHSSEVRLKGGKVVRHQDNRRSGTRELLPRFLRALPEPLRRCRLSVRQAVSSSVSLTSARAIKVRRCCPPDS